MVIDLTQGYGFLPYGMTPYGRTEGVSAIIQPLDIDMGDGTVKGYGVRAGTQDDLAITDSDGNRSIGVAEDDVTELVFNSDDGVYASSEVTIRQRDTGVLLDADTYLTVDELEDAAAVTIRDLVRGYSYEIVMTFTYDDGTTASGLFIVDCVG